MLKYFNATNKSFWHAACRIKQFVIHSFFETQWPISHQMKVWLTAIMTVLPNLINHTDHLENSPRPKGRISQVRHTANVRVNETNLTFRFSLFFVYFNKWNSFHRNCSHNTIIVFLFVRYLVLLHPSSNIWLLPLKLNLYICNGSLYKQTKMNSVSIDDSVIIRKVTYCDPQK